MKSYSIGRELNCDIVINDPTDVISRRHAILTVAPSGKMTIIDQSSNGTYVNGIRISPNVPVPVTRKDMISLAHVAKLDWSLVPRSLAWIKYAAAGIAAVAAIIGIAILIRGMKISGGSDEGNGQNPSTVQADSTIVKQREAAIIDSVKAAEHQQDSIKNEQEKARQDSIRKAKKAAAPAAKKDSTEVKDEETPVDSTSQNRKRTIG